MKSYVTDNVELYMRDAFAGMRSIDENTIDLAIVDPPYGASTRAQWAYDSKFKVTGFGGKWKLSRETWDLIGQSENFITTFAWLQELKRLVKPTGSIWIHSTYHNSGFVNVSCQLLGLEIINEVAWYKRNAFPNLSRRRLTASHETILWVHTGQKKREYRFNYDDTKIASFVEDNLKEPNKQLRTVWDIPNNKSREELLFGSHPTQKPLRLSERLLLISGIRRGNLLVPFAGSGTEMIAGVRYGMHVIGFEVDEQFFCQAQLRLDHEQRKARSRFQF